MQARVRRFHKNDHSCSICVFFYFIKSSRLSNADVRLVVDAKCAEVQCCFTRTEYFTSNFDIFDSFSSSLHI